MAKGCMYNCCGGIGVNEKLSRTIFWIPPKAVAEIERRGWYANLSPKASNKLQKPSDTTAPLIGESRSLAVPGLSNHDFFPTHDSQTIQVVVGTPRPHPRQHKHRGKRGAAQGSGFAAPLGTPLIPPTISSVDGNNGWREVDVTRASGPDGRAGSRGVHSK